MKGYIDIELSKDSIGAEYEFHTPVTIKVDKIEKNKIVISYDRTVQKVQGE